MKFGLSRLKLSLSLLFVVALAAIVWLSLHPRSFREGEEALAWLRTESPVEPAGEEEEGEEGGEGEGARRASWFYEQRAYPLTTIPRGARNSAVRDLEREEGRMRAQRQRGRSASLALADELVWAPIGPAPLLAAQTFGTPRSNVSGRVAALALDPRYNGSSNQTIYLGAAQGGVWRSIDNGVQWEPITDGLPSLAVGAIAIDPTNPDVIFVGTGEGNRSGDSYYGAGLFKSTDSGATWTQITGPTSTTAPGLPSFLNATFMRIEIDPTSPSTVYVATNVGVTGGATGGGGTAPIGNRGVWKSTDGGINWRNLNPVNDGVDRSATDVLLDPRNPQRVYAMILNIGIYRSESGGEPGTWQKLTNGLPDSDPNNPTFRRVLLAVGPPLSPSTATTLYAAFGAANEDLLGIWRSTNNGTSWNRLTTPQDSGQANYNLALAVDPVDANVAYYGTSANNGNNGGTVWRTTNGGQVWTDLSRGSGTGGLHADTHSIVVSPLNRNIVLTANDGGVWRTTGALNPTVTWLNLNDSLNITQFQSIALHPTNPNIVIGGTQDNGTNRYDGNISWAHIRDGDGGYTLIDQTTPQTMYHTFFNQNNSDGSAVLGPEISTNGGDSWQPRGCFGCAININNIHPADRVGFYAPMALHSGFTAPSGNVIYYGTHRLYRSANQGIIWKGLGPGIDGFGTDLTKGGTARLSAIAAFPKLDNATPTPGETIWVGTNDGNVQLTTNAGDIATATFTNVTKAPMPNRFVSDIGLDSTDQRHAVVTYSGFTLNTPTTPGHVFRTLDRGATWTDISGNLPDVPVTSVALDPTESSRIFVGTDIGVFVTADGGTTWARLGNGLPRIGTYMVRYQAATNTLYAATHGRGIFRLTTSRALATVSAASFDPAAIASESIVASFGSGLSLSTVVASTIPLPLVLDGSRIVVTDSGGTDRAAPLLFVSPAQANFQIPPGTAAGPAMITITSSTGNVSKGEVQVSVVAPALFAANSEGTGAASGSAIRVDVNQAQTSVPLAVLNGSNVFVTNPIDLGVASDQTFLVLFGSGIRFRSALSNVTLSVGQAQTEVIYAGSQLTFVGLDQVNVIVPRSVIGQGEVDVRLTADGKVANILRVKFK
ncbi:MAG: hypothetical protein ABI882_01355 [Acidobacteriota bacterium]